MGLLHVRALPAGLSHEHQYSQTHFQYPVQNSTGQAAQGDPGVLRPAHQDRVGHGAAKEDFKFTVLDVAEEIREDHPGFEDLEVTVDRVGARMVLNQNSREPVTEPEEMGPLWKVLHMVGADWTYPSVMWAGENYCMFLADDEGWRYIIEEFALHVDNNLKSPLVVNTE